MHEALYRDSGGKEKGKSHSYQSVYLASIDIIECIQGHNNKWEVWLPWVPIKYKASLSIYPICQTTIQ